MTAQIIHVARNYSCDRATAELGEDFPELKKIERAYRLLEARLERAAVKVQSDRATNAVLELGSILAEGRHDSSFGCLLAMAQDAHAEARVTPTIVRRVA